MNQSDSILTQSPQALTQQLADWGIPSWRTKQIQEWIFHHRAVSFEACANLPKTLREKLSSHYKFYSAPLLCVTGHEGETRKFLWKLCDGNLIESVLIPAPAANTGHTSSNSEENRNTLCISTQVGCACGCKFCASGRSGFIRNLAPEEIIDQLLGAERWNPHQNKRLIHNLVIMGMGEPLANYENLMKALSIMNAEWGANIGARKITVSTSGLAPKIRRLAAEEAQYRLSISLHAATDAVRSLIMPINRKYPLKELLDACEAYQQTKGRMISFEYILIDRLNDTPSQCQGLIRIARRFHAHINLIPYNPVEGCDFKRPPQETIRKFTSELLAAGISATLRQEKGGNIDAACGQLRLRKMKDLSEK